MILLLYSGGYLIEVDNCYVANLSTLLLSLPTLHVLVPHALLLVSPFPEVRDLHSLSLHSLHLIPSPEIAPRASSD
jgi:hypothetical protein